jgi:hypothetical protein
MSTDVWQALGRMARCASIERGLATSGHYLHRRNRREGGYKSLDSRIVMWRVGLQWYLFAVVGIPAITVLGAVVLPAVPVFCLVGHEPSERTAIEHPRNRWCGLYRKPCL